MPLTLARTADPVTEPVSLAEAKLHLRADGPDEDGLIAGLVAAARDWCESWTGRAFAPQTWRLSLDAFPCLYEMSVGGYGQWIDGTSVLLPRPPLVSVASVQYVDTAGATQTLAASEYQVDADSEPGRLMPAYGKIWPVSRAQLNAAQVTYRAGWPLTTVPLAVAQGAQTVTPASMAGITAGRVLVVGEGAKREAVSVTAVTATTFSATFAQGHAAGVRVSGVPDSARQAILLLVGHWWLNREAVGQAPGGPLGLAVEALLTRWWTGEQR